MDQALGNCSFNPVSALTGASLDLIGAYEACRDVVQRIMLECKTVGEAIGAEFAVDVERRIDGGGDRRIQAFDPLGCREGQVDGARCPYLDGARIGSSPWHSYADAGCGRCAGGDAG